jgi:hypothetical protein
LAARAADALAEASPEDFAAAIEKEREGRRVPIPILERLDSTLARTEPPLHEYFRGVSRMASVLLARVCHVLSKPVRRDEDAGSWLTASGEAVRGDAGSGASWALDAQSARYLELLEVLVERAVDLLERETHGAPADTPPTLYLEVQRRDVATKEMPRSQSLKRQHLLEIVDRLGADRTLGVDIVPKPPKAYHETMDPLFVLADFVASRTRWSVKKNKSLSRTEQLIRSWTGSLVRARSVSLLAADGSPRTAVNASRSGDHDSLEAARDRWATTPVRRWAREQAEEWIAVVSA